MMPDPVPTVVWVSSDGRAKTFDDALDLETKPHVHFAYGTVSIRSSIPVTSLLDVKDIHPFAFPPPFNAFLVPRDAVFVSVESSIGDTIASAVDDVRDDLDRKRASRICCVVSSCHAIADADVDEHENEMDIPRDATYIDDGLECDVADMNDDADIILDEDVEVDADEDDDEDDDGDDSDGEIVENDESDSEDEKHDEKEEDENDGNAVARKGGGEAPSRRYRTRGSIPR